MRDVKGDQHLIRELLDNPPDEPPRSWFGFGSVEKETSRKGPGEHLEASRLTACQPVSPGFPSNSSIGVEHSTVSKLKEYPPALCRGLAEAFLDVARARSGPVQPVDAHTQQWLQNLYVQWDPCLPVHCD